MAVSIKRNLPSRSWAEVQTRLEQSEDGAVEVLRGRGGSFVGAWARRAPGDYVLCSPLFLDDVDNGILPITAEGGGGAVQTIGSASASWDSGLVFDGSVVIVAAGSRGDACVVGATLDVDPGTLTVGQQVALGSCWRVNDPAFDPQSAGVGADVQSGPQAYVQAFSGNSQAPGGSTTSEAPEAYGSTASRSVALGDIDRGLWVRSYGGASNSQGYMGVFPGLDALGQAAARGAGELGGVGRDHYPWLWADDAGESTFEAKCTKLIWRST